MKTSSLTSPKSGTAQCHTLRVAHRSHVCNPLQLTSTHCNCNTLQLQHNATATHCNTLQHAVAYSNTHVTKVLQLSVKPCKWHTDLTYVTHCNTLQKTATHCNTLQNTATQCSTMQRLATQT